MDRIAMIKREIYVHRYNAVGGLCYSGLCRCRFAGNVWFRRAFVSGTMSGRERSSIQTVRAGRHINQPPAFNFFGAIRERHMKLSDMTDEQRELVSKLHAEAVANGQLKYIDPFSKTPEGEPRLVSTEIRHQERGYCCRSACRHCPYGYND